MSGARVLHVVQAPPFLTVQDLGRPGLRHLGVPAGGAMDPWALRTANALVGNAEGAAGLEWAVGGGMVRFECAATVALVGTDAEVWIGDRPAPTCATLAVAAGETLTVGRLGAGRFLYLAVGGGIDVPAVLGGRGTYLPAGFGGWAGRRLAAGDALPLGAPPAAAPRPGFTCPADLAPPAPAGDDAPIRVTEGPQAARLTTDGWAALLGQRFVVTAASDRTGYRLEGEPLALTSDVVAPSEPGCAGALQLPPGGQPIVLMADAPTVGGYPKPAVVCAADLGRLAQRPPGAEVRFARVTVAEAQRLYRRARIRVDTVVRREAQGARS